MDSSGESDDDEPVQKDHKFWQVTRVDKMTIFFGVRNTMVNGRMKRGILKNIWIDNNFSTMGWHAKKLTRLLNNQDEADREGIVHTSYDILFGIKHSDHRKGKYKYDHEALKAAALAIHQDRRPSLWHLSAQMGIPLIPLYYLLKGHKAPMHQNVKTIFIQHWSKLKPTLTDENKLTWFLLFLALGIKTTPLPPVCKAPWSLMNITTESTLMRSGIGCQKMAASTSLLRVNGLRTDCFRHKIIAMVKQAFDEFPASKVNRIFVTLVSINKFHCSLLTVSWLISNNYNDGAILFAPSLLGLVHPSPTFGSVK
jgi:hypothetical protein